MLIPRYNSKQRGLSELNSDLKVSYLGSAEDTAALVKDMTKYSELIMVLTPYKAAQTKVFYTFTLPTSMFEIQSNIYLPLNVSSDGIYATRITASATGISVANTGSGATSPKVWIYGR